MVLLPAVVKDDGSLAYVFLPFLLVSSFFFFFLFLRAISFGCHRHSKFLTIVLGQVYFEIQTSGFRKSFKDFFFNFCLCRCFLKYLESNNL